MSQTHQWLLFHSAIVCRLHFGSDYDHGTDLVVEGEILDGWSPSLAEDEDLLWSGAALALCQFQLVLGHQLIQLQVMEIAQAALSM